MDTIRGAGRGLLVTTVLALAAWGPGVGELRAQTVTGRVLDESGERGIPLVSIEAFGPEDEPLGSTRTDELGDFVLRLTRPMSPFRIDARAFTYRMHSVPALEAAPGDTLALAPFSMTTVPISLAPITGTIEQPLVSRGSEWVRQGQLTGRGTFFAGAVLTVLEPPSLTAYLAENTGLRLLYNAFGVPYLRSDAALETCVRVQINRWPIGNTSYRSIDQVPIDRIAAIEVYNTYRDVPDALAWDADRCGLVNIWTWDSY